LGVPVISSNSGGLSEVNFEGCLGIQKMAENALKILKDSTTLQNLKKMRYL
jgi:hypothetical protein